MTKEDFIPSASNGNDGDGSQIQSPDISESGKPRNKSIKDAGQARDIIRNHQQAGRDRQIVNARLISKYNSTKPYDQCKLDADGTGWRSNFSTQPMAQAIEKAFPRYTQAIDALKYFTDSSLPSSWENSSVKTEAFREGITTLFRSRKGWQELISDIALQTVLFGYCTVAQLDEFNFFPKAFAQDEVWLSDGTRQTVATAQIAILKEVYLPHELFALIKDRESAETVGWEIQETIEQINKASPAQIRDAVSSPNSLSSMYENMQRELTLGSSYQAGASVVTVYSLLAREVDGKVSHYRFAGTELTKIFDKEDRFKSMEDVLNFFCFQKGNGTYYGSKGIGRALYELAGMSDRIKNEAVDRAIMSGKIIVQGDLKQLHKFKMSVLGMTCFMPREWQISEQKFQGAPEEFLRLDAYFSQLMDQIAGVTSIPNIQGEAFRSSAAINLLASREEEGRDTKIARFLDFFIEMVSTMQRRACDPDTSEKDAKEFQKKMLEIMSREELDILGNQVAATAVQDLTSMQRQMVAAIAQETRGNPFYNARQLEIEDITARVDADFANKIILPVEDPTQTAEQSRLQMFELTLLSGGQAVPVSPRDNHEIHAQILQPVLEEMAAALQQGQTGTAVFEAAVAHLQEHSQQAAAAGGNKEFWKPIDKFLKDANKTLGQLKALDAEAEQLAGESAAYDEELAAEGAQPTA